MKRMALFVACVIVALPLAAQGPPDDVGGSGGGGDLVPLQPNAIVVETGFDGTEPTMDGRLNRDGVPSTCSPPKPWPGDFALGNQFAYKVFGPYTNGTNTCITVNFDPDTPVGPNPCTTEAHAMAYLGSFNPLDRSQNYLGDVGSSVAQPFSFPAAENSQILIVVQSNFTTNPICSFDFSSNELSEPVPVMGSRAMALLALLLLSAGLLVTGWSRSSLI